MGGRQLKFDMAGDGDCGNLAVPADPTRMMNGDLAGARGVQE
jgi:hypothetical protein